MTASKDWVMAKDAPALLARPKSTIYKWVESGQVRTFRPLHEKWLFVPDLRRMDRDTPRRRRAKQSA